VDSGSGLGNIPVNQVGNSSTYVTEKNKNNQKTKLMKVDKNKLKKNPKKFPELKMVVNGDYRNSNYTMFSDDE
jgi:hypothetical protein